MARPAVAPSAPRAATEDDYRRAGLMPPTDADLARFAQPLPAAPEAATPLDLGAAVLQKAIELGFPILAEFIKSWLTPSTPVHGGSKPIMAHEGELIRLWIHNPDDYLTVMLNDKMVGGASLGQTVEVLADTAKKGLNLIVGKLENSGGFEWGVDMAARREGHDWASEVHVGGNEGMFKTSHLVLIQVYGQ